MNKNLVILAIVLVILIAGGLLAYNAYQANQTVQPTVNNSEGMITNTPPTDTPVVSQTTMEEGSPSAEGSPQQTKNTVTISSTGFSPESITIKKGESVTWVNSDTTNHTVNSDNHPTHLLYPVLNKAGLIKPAESKSVKFDQTGTFTYHDHLNAALVGKVIVK